MYLIHFQNRRIQEVKTDEKCDIRFVNSCVLRDDHAQLSFSLRERNKGFGTEFTLADQLFFDQVIETELEDVKIKEDPEVNTHENFMNFFGKFMEGLFIGRMEGNEEIFTKLMNDDKMMKIATQQVGKDVYNRVRK